MGFRLDADLQSNLRNSNLLIGTVPGEQTNIANSAGEGISDQRRVTWKLSVIMPLKPLRESKQEFKADVTYAERWINKVRPNVGRTLPNAAGAPREED